MTMHTIPMLKSKGKTCMVDEPSHVKQLPVSLNHVCKIRLTTGSFAMKKCKPQNCIRVDTFVYVLMRKKYMFTCLARKDIWTYSPPFFVSIERECNPYINVIRKMLHIS